MTLFFLSYLDTEWIFKGQCKIRTNKNENMLIKNCNYVQIDVY
ncbi:hypothetical protein HMPREF1250_1791 [Megasphaera vaginalis (ex Srinivasan et al. 2021)]|uniref:Uncharacterized protein n=1 Tax=Megasphaera vaginalis (ex Srinivasan et al. 2021) TaxID=1111454 RepID=U7UH77_9FIRM|nr:hypothetical protein HMPREF1250_1791 [Megasphaera vaginalis (ex Srinivasan et al. 2021)]